MGEYNIGQFVCCSRKALGISQEELCGVEDEACCSVETLSRIECGKQRPNYKTIRKLMKRLGKENCFCVSYLKTEDYQVLELNRELKRALSLNEYERAEMLLRELEGQLSLQYVTNRQYLIRTHALIDRQLGRITPEEEIALMEAALLMTLHSYGTELFRYEMLMSQEIIMVCNIANAYGALGNFDKTIELLQVLKDMLYNETLQRHYPPSVFEVVERNWVKWIGNQGRYEEAIREGNQAIDYCIETGVANTLCDLHYARAYNFQELKERSPAWQDYDQKRINFDLEMSIQLSELFGVEYVKQTALGKIR